MATRSWQARSASPVTQASVGHRRRPWWVLFWIALPLVLWWSFRSVPAGEVWMSLDRLTMGAILGLLALNALVLVSFSGRWWLILRAQGYRHSYWSLVGYRLAGFGISYFTPGPQLGGEPLQVYLLSRRGKIPAPIAMVSVTLDKMVELWANFSFLLVGISITLVSGLIDKSASYLLLLLPVGMLILLAGYLLALWIGKLPATKILRRLVHRFPGLPRITGWSLTLQTVEEESSRFFHEHPGTILIALIVSFLTCVFTILEFGLALRFLGLNLGFSKIIIVLTATRLAFLLPVPAGIGTLETGQMLAMGLIGASPVIGISLSMLIRIRDASLAGFGLWWGGLLTRSVHKITAEQVSLREPIHFS